ncbi:MAG: hypothetical protein ACTSVY_01130 [Candidatus Helarchaeota archaeon]
MSIKGSIWKRKQTDSIISVLNEIEKSKEIKIVQKRHYFSIWKGPTKRKNNFLVGIHVYDKYFNIITRNNEEIPVNSLEETKKIINEIINQVK